MIPFPHPEIVLRHDIEDELILIYGPGSDPRVWTKVLPDGSLAHVAYCGVL